MRASLFTIRGVLEAFYGTFYTADERNDLIRFLGANGFNLYLYGPKNDRHHRRHWREPYPARFMAEFAETVAIGREAGVSIAYTLSPTEDIVYSSAEDFAQLTGKLRAFYDVGVRAFSLFFDDTTPVFIDARDRERYSGYGEAHADLCNRTYAWLQTLDPECSLSMCPTEYHGFPPFKSYLYELGAELDPAIDVFYTGLQICSATIAVEDVAAFAGAVGRVPIIWDNYPVNDLDMQAELHIGPIRGRDAALYEVARGVAANLMLQPRASKIPLQTYGEYLADPHGYDPERAWARALGEAGGEEGAEALRLLAENSLRSYLGTPEAERFSALVAAAVAAMRGGEPASDSVAVQALDSYLRELDAACYYLRHYLPDAALRRELQPWSERLQAWQELGQFALRLLRGEVEGSRGKWNRQRLAEIEAELGCRYRRIAEEALAPLLAYVRTAMPAIAATQEVAVSPVFTPALATPEVTVPVD